MGFSLFSNGDKINYGIKNYIADTLNDLNKIPCSAPGSMVFVIENSTYYMLNNKQEWLKTEMTQNSSSIEPSGTIDIIENGNNINIAAYATANVQVPIPSEYIIPSGTKEITANADGIDVAAYQYADVAVPVPTIPDEYATGGSISDGTVTGYYVKRGVTSIAENKFRYASPNLETINMPDTITDIGGYAFYQLSKLELSKLPSQLTTIGSNAFNSCSKMTLSEGLPIGITSIAQRAFQGCSKLDFAELPDGITTLLQQCFASCASLHLQKLPRYLVSIADACFSMCGDVCIDEIPATVTSIGENAFYDNRSIASITFKGTPTSISATAFRSCTNLLNIYVPWSEDAVANAPWGATNATIVYDYIGG